MDTTEGTVPLWELGAKAVRRDQEAQSEDKQKKKKKRGSEDGEDEKFKPDSRRSQQ